jgi:small subunit ribosomal protein S16
VADSRAARDGAFVEQLGHYDPLTDPPMATIDVDKARYWIRNGAQPSEAVARILKRLEDAVEVEGQ